MSLIINFMCILPKCFKRENRDGLKEENWVTWLYCCCSAAKSCLILWDPMDFSPPGFPVLHCPLELALTYVHWVGDAIQPSNLLLPVSLPAFNLSQHQGLFQRVSSSYQVAKVLELQLQPQSFQWIFRVDFFSELTGLAGFSHLETKILIFCVVKYIPKCIFSLLLDLESFPIPKLKNSLLLSFQSQRKAMPKNAQTTTQLHSSHMLVK